jgi:ComF family protein
MSTAMRKALDFVLPPRCAGCGEIIDDVHSFCANCWGQLEFLGDHGCATCGRPLQATDAEQCGACLARPPRILRTRAAVAYDDVSRTLAIRLKYARKIALARTMGRFMAPLVKKGAGDEAILVPVPLHRRRLWSRGFNQSALIARDLARRTGLPADVTTLVRVKPTAPLKGMSQSERARTVAGAFRLTDPAAVSGKRVVLVDDVLTTGSTAEACAKTLQRAGAASVDLVCWARVIRPTRL